MNTTVVIVSFKSEHLIRKNIEHFDYNTPIIIIDNSKNINLAKDSAQETIKEVEDALGIS